MGAKVLKQTLDGLCHPSKPPCKRENLKGMCDKRTSFLLVAETTKAFNSKALLFKPFFLKKPSKKSVQSRTLKGKGLDSQILLQRFCSYADWRHPAA